MPRGSSPVRTRKTRSPLAARPLPQLQECFTVRPLVAAMRSCAKVSHGHRLGFQLSNQPLAEDSLFSDCDAFSGLAILRSGRLRASHASRDSSGKGVPRWSTSRTVSMYLRAFSWDVF